MVSYWPVLIMIAIAAAVALASILVSSLIGIRADAVGAKLDPYECGVESDGSTLLHVPVKFYLVALLFLIFDVETIFIISWAVAYGELGATAAGAFYWLMAGGLFGAILVVGLVYEWKRGALDWQ